MKKAKRKPPQKWGIWNWIDHLVISRFNWLDTAIGFVAAYPWYDIAQLKIPRADLNDGIPSHDRIRKMLKDHGIKTFWPGFDGGHTYIRLRRRQLKWAKYVLEKNYKLEL